MTVSNNWTQRVLRCRSKQKCRRKLRDYARILTFLARPSKTADLQSSSLRAGLTRSSGFLRAKEWGILVPTPTLLETNEASRWGTSSHTLTRTAPTSTWATLPRKKLAKELGPKVKQGTTPRLLPCRVTLEDLLLKDWLEAPTKVCTATFL